MKIKTVDISRFRNHEHFQFQTEFRDLIILETPEKLKIVSLFPDYLICYNNEDTAIQKIIKNATTNNIEEADKKRDKIYRGMMDTNKAALNHFDDQIRIAAERLRVVFDTFGNLAIKPLNEETSGIYNLLQELNANYADEIVKTGVASWTTALDDANKTFDELVKKRNDENTSKTELKVTQTRIEIDKLYGAIAERINALIIVEGEGVYESFVKKLNGYIEKYNNIVARRYGRGEKKNQKQTD